MVTPRSQIPHLERIVTATRKVACYRPGRVCAKRGCRVILSRYNRDIKCSAHQPRPVGRGSLGAV